MQENFTLVEIEQRTRISLERLRYVVDSNILPEARTGRRAPQRSHGRGIARTFTAWEAFGLIVAVSLLEGGLRRQLVTEALEILCGGGAARRGTVDSVPLYQAFTSPDVIALEVGDGFNVRLIGEARRRKGRHKIVWIQAATGAVVSRYEPQVRITIDLRKAKRWLEP